MQSAMVRILTLLPIFWIALAGSALQEAGAAADQRELALTGTKLSEAQIQALEEKLKAEPDDLQARIRLLGYYKFRGVESDPAREAHQKHALWVIQHHPTSEIAGSPFARLHPTLAPEAHAKADELWQQHIEADPQNVRLLGNAADFFIPSRLEVAEAYLKQAKTIEPKSPRWPERLAHVYNIQSGDAPVERRKQVAAQMLAELELAHRLSNEEGQFYLLTDLAEAALKAGATDKARDYARQAFEMAEQYQNNWNYGNAIHQGHIVLGRLAVRSGNVDEAKEHLRQAGQTPGSPQLNSFGPDMTLAHELLEKGERKVVIEYLRLVGGFWQMSDGQLEQWISVIQDGGTPDFGRHLLY